MVELTGESLRNFAMTVGPNNEMLFCSTTWITGGSTLEFLRIGKVVAGTYEYRDVLASTAVQNSVCLDIAMHPVTGAPVWLVGFDGDVKIVTLTGDVFADATMNTETVTDGSDLAALSIDANMTGEIIYDAQDREFVTITPNQALVLYVNSTMGWTPWWFGWNTGNYLSGGPPIWTLHDVVGISPSLAYVIEGENPGLYTENGGPTGTFDPPPFDFEQVDAGRTLGVWTTAAGLAEFVYTQSDFTSPGSKLVFGQRSGPASSSSEDVATDFFTDTTRFRGRVADGLYIADETRPTLAVVNTRVESTLMTTTITAKLEVLAHDGAQWQQVAIAEHDDDGFEVFGPRLIQVGCGRPGIYFVEEDQSADIVRLQYREAAP